MCRTENAYPGYFTLKNFHNQTRKDTAEQAMILLFSLPILHSTSPLSCAPLQPVLILVVTVPEVDRQHKQWPAFVRQLVHACLGIVFSILKTLPENGIPFVCPDKEYRLGFLRLAAWIADYKEQVRLALIVSGRCAICVASRAEMNLLRAFPVREGTVSDKLRMGGLSEKDQKTLGLKPGLVSRILGF
jgi:hypothetical protein